MTKITENDIELLAIEELEKLGYTYVHGTTLASGEEADERRSFEEVVLAKHLQTAIAKINPKIPAAAQQDALKEVLRIHSHELPAAPSLRNKSLSQVSSLVRTKLLSLFISCFV